MGLTEEKRKELSELCGIELVDVYWFSGVSTICVALTRKAISNKLACYIAAVEGVDMTWDLRKAISLGTKVPEHIARTIFPQYTDEYAE